jgi:hypothetical protein
VRQQRAVEADKRANVDDEVTRSDEVFEASRVGFHVLLRVLE